MENYASSQSVSVLVRRGVAKTGEVMSVCSRFWLVVGTVCLILVGCNSRPASSRGRFIVFCGVPRHPETWADLQIQVIDGQHLASPLRRREDGSACTDPIHLEAGPMGQRTGYEVHGPGLTSVTAYTFTESGNVRETPLFRETATLGWRVYIEVPATPSQVPVLTPGIGDPARLGQR